MAFYTEFGLDVGNLHIKIPGSTRRRGAGFIFPSSPKLKVLSEISYSRFFINPNKTDSLFEWDGKPLDTPLTQKNFPPNVIATRRAGIFNQYFFIT